MRREQDRWRRRHSPRRQRLKLGGTESCAVARTIMPKLLPYDVDDDEVAEQYVREALRRSQRGNWTALLADDCVMQTYSSTGVRVDVCLFGSLENTADYVGGSDQPPAGWSSSAARTIALYIQSRGTVNNSQWDDPESLAVEALKIATEQGVTGTWDEHQNKPWTRGFTFGHATESEWYAQIYNDVVLDKDRWTFNRDGGISPGVERILIGAPLWVRTPGAHAITRYRDLRQGSDRRHDARPLPDLDGQHSRH